MRNIKDWTGSKRSAYATIGARNYAQNEREINDYYATSPRRVERLLKYETFNPNVWECACGEGHISKVLERYGYNVRSTDLIDRGFGMGGVDFLMQTEKFDGDIITNPPYKYALQFVKKSLELVNDGRRVCMLLKLTFLEGQKRHAFFVENPPRFVYVAVKRVSCGINGKFDQIDKNGRVAYAWFIWEKGFKGEPSIRWFNYD